MVGGAHRDLSFLMKKFFKVKSWLNGGLKLEMVSNFKLLLFVGVELF